MAQDRDSKTAGESFRQAVHEFGTAADAVGEKVRPVASLGVDTVEGIVNAVESANSARRRLWTALTNFSERAREDEESATRTVKSLGSNELAGAASDVVASAASAKVAASGIWKTLTDIAPSSAGNDGERRSALDPRRWVSESPGVVKNVAGSVGGLLPGKEDSDDALRSRGEKLIARSQIPDYTFGGRHPAFSYILEQMNPDEARIVRFLYKAGVQPAIDIRTKTLFQIGSERILGGVNLIALQASCRWPKAGREYLANLNRLGLVRFSAEPVADIRRYSVLEVQDEAMDAIESVKSAICIYRSIYLSQFGRQFAEICFDMTSYNAGGWDTDGRHDKILGSGPPKPKHKH
ncbi:Abi-alpha family protein [Antrihabitans stalactiti]|nr:Abi-alpha family protein [Antrihabitans stalactiti]